MLNLFQHHINCINKNNIVLQRHAELVSVSH